MKLQLNLSVVVELIIAGLLGAALLGAWSFYGDMREFQGDIRQFQRSVLQRLENIERQMSNASRMPNQLRLSKGD